MLTQTCPPGYAEAYRSAMMHFEKLQGRRRPEAIKRLNKSRAKNGMSY